MKATSLRLEDTRTPTCHSFLYPGGFKALWTSMLSVVWGEHYTYGTYHSIKSAE
jgi:hypothetical protein